MTVRNLIDLVREVGLIKLVDCCGVPDKFCAGDQWKGNLRSFANLVREDYRNQLALEAQSTTVQESKQPEFYSEFEYNFSDSDVFVCVYRRRADATPELVHRKQLPRQAQPATEQQHCAVCESPDHKETCDSPGAILTRTTGCPTHDSNSIP